MVKEREKVKEMVLGLGWTRGWVGEGVGLGLGETEGEGDGVGRGVGVGVGDITPGPES